MDRVQCFMQPRTEGRINKQLTDKQRERYRGVRLQWTFSCECGMSSCYTRPNDLLQSRHIHTASD